ncbi:MAG: DUF5990 family protein [Pyrinomonadaceae bacterium]
MKQEVPIRITVENPIRGVVMQVQRGRYELLAPSEMADGSIAFDLSITVDLSTGDPNFLGKYAQGPKDARFVYVNSGKSAGQLNSCWERRAKISLMSIAKEQIESVLRSPTAHLEAKMNGVGRDGGPTCASVKGIVWTVAKS